MRCDGARAAVMTGDEELAIAEPLHDLDLVLRHRAERVVDVVLAAVLGTDAVAVAAQVGTDDMEAFGQTSGDLVPGGVASAGCRAAAAAADRRRRDADGCARPLVSISVRVKPSNMLRPLVLF